jgi:hypothetical protein
MRRPRPQNGCDATEREREKELGKYKIATAEMKILGTPQNTRCFTTKGIRTF